MKRCRSPLAAALATFTVLGAGCSSPAGPPTETAAGREAVEQARREERLKLMQQYWYDQTAAAPDPSAAGAGPAAPPRPLLSYPAGVYAGLRFGPRLAPDPSLAEPDR